MNWQALYPQAHENSETGRTVVKILIARQYRKDKSKFRSPHVGYRIKAHRKGGVGRGGMALTKEAKLAEFLCIKHEHQERSREFFHPRFFTHRASVSTAVILWKGEQYIFGQANKENS